MIKFMSILTGFLVGLVLPWHIKRINEITSQNIEQDIEQDTPDTFPVYTFPIKMDEVDIDWLNKLAVEIMSQQDELMSQQSEITPHVRPRVGVWLAEDEYGIPYVRQNGVWVRVGRDF